MPLAVPKDSRVTLDWLTRACQQNPVQKIFDEKGQFTGNYLTGPGRLSFPYLFKKKPNKAGPGQTGRETYQTAFLWAPGMDIAALNNAVGEEAVKAFPGNHTPQGFVWHGLHTPWHDQAEKTMQYQGYTPGAISFNTGSDFKPRVVDPNMNDIIDEARVYPGVWAMLAVNVYPYGHNKAVPRKGISIGLQSVVIIGDDQNIGGGGQVDPRQAFAGIKLDANVNVAAGFGVPIAGATGAPLPTGGAVMGIDALRAMGLV